MPDSVVQELWQLVPTAVYFVVGALLFAFSIWTMGKVVPFSMRKEIEEDQNTALGVIMAGVLIGLSIIMSAAIQG